VEGSTPNAGCGNATLPESKAATGPDGFAGIRCSSGDYAAISTGHRAATAPGRDAYLRRIAACAIRMVRHEQRQQKLADDLLSGKVRVEAMNSHWDKLVAARKALFEAVDAA
jgi:hypothetical protein